jgi:hypothetical protein
MKAIKLYAWEGPYAERITKLRDAELSKIRYIPLSKDPLVTFQRMDCSILAHSTVTLTPLASCMDLINVL